MSMEASEQNAPQDLPEQKVTIWISISTFILYVFQSAPYGFFESLFPVLYGLEGFDEENLSWFRFSGVPWCLKFIFGIIFQMFWQPPRWFIIIAHILSGALLIPLTWIPLDNMIASISLFFIINTITVMHDSVFDGQMIVLFDGNAVLLELIQLSAYLVFDVVLSFVGISFYTPYLFLIIGVLSVLSTALLFVYKWPKLPTKNLTNIWGNFKDTIWVAVVIFLYFFFTAFGDSMLSYFGAEINSDEEKLGVIFGLYMIGAFIGMTFGQYFFLKVTYHVGTIIALIVEALSVLFFVFLTDKSSYGLQITMFLLAGFTTSSTDAIVQTLSIDASGSGDMATFTYSWLQSLVSIGSTLGGIAFPLCKKSLSWTNFWITNAGVCVGLAIVFALLFIFIPSARKEHSLAMKPTASLPKCCDKQQTTEEDDNSI